MMKCRRRNFVAGLAAVAGGLAAGQPAPAKRKALIAITLDLEMSRNFPNWEDTHWDYEKGNLDAASKAYAEEAGRRVKAAGGVVHYFAVGRVCEQRNVDWLKRLAMAGHPIGNHTYDHVNVLAKRPEDIQFRFARSPWLIDGMPVSKVLSENIRLASAALQTRVGAPVAGFRTPGGFHRGLQDRPDVRGMLRELGFAWVSSMYPPHPMPKPGVPPDDLFLRELVASQNGAAPFVYSDGLIEVPMSPISDIVAFRTGRWKLDWFVTAVDAAVRSVIATGGVFDFLCHPSCLGVVDPEFRTIDRILELAANANGRAALVPLDAFVDRAKTS